MSYNFWSTSSLMAAYYEIYNSTANWLIRKGLKRNIANSYISELFLALSKDAAIKKNIGFKKLVTESQTPGGLNMRVLKELKKKGFYSNLEKSLSNILKKIKS